MDGKVELTPMEIRPGGDCSGHWELPDVPDCCTGSWWEVRTVNGKVEYRGRAQIGVIHETMEDGQLVRLKEPPRQVTTRVRFPQTHRSARLVLVSSDVGPHRGANKKAIDVASVKLPLMLRGNR